MLFHLMAVKEGIEWGDLNSFALRAPKAILLFAISKAQGNSIEGLGITASSDNADRINEVKKELAEVLAWLNDRGFEIIDLFLGEKLRHIDKDSILDYY